MSEPWTKLYARILRSSVWKLPSDVRIVWLTLLALKDENGIVRGSVGWVAEEARVSPKICQEALDIFASPDPKSRTEDNEGRKIKAIDGGWEVLNHHKYRDGIEEQQEKWRRQKAIQRAREKAARVRALEEHEEDGEMNGGIDSVKCGECLKDLSECWCSGSLDEILETLRNAPNMYTTRYYNRLVRHAKEIKSGAKPAAHHTSSTGEGGGAWPQRTGNGNPFIVGVVGNGEGAPE